MDFAFWIAEEAIRRRAAPNALLPSKFIGMRATDEIDFAVPGGGRAGFDEELGWPVKALEPRKTASHFRWRGIGRAYVVTPSGEACPKYLNY